jgi:hypothetical protein
LRILRRDDGPPGSELPAHTGPPTGRGKGRPQTDPEGTRSALPATEAAGTLIGCDARRRYRGRADVGAGFRSAAMGQGSQPRAAPSPGSLPPVPIQSPKGSTRPICLRMSPTMEVQVRRHINEEPQVLNHAVGVRHVLRHLSTVSALACGFSAGQGVRSAMR